MTKHPDFSSFKLAAKEFLAGRLSRRSFLSRGLALGLSSSALMQVSDLLAGTGGQESTLVAGASYNVHDRGGSVFVEQLKLCGIKFIFANPSSSTGPFFDALIDRDDMHVILCPHEGPLTAMANGYGKASKKTPFVSVSKAGFPNAGVNMFNSFKDRTPMIVSVDESSDETRGGHGFQEVDDLSDASSPFTRWRWESRQAASIAADVRRCFKFAATPPHGPVFLSVPDDFFFESVESEIIDISRFTLSDKIRADQSLVQDIANRLLDAENPLLYVGDEVYLTDAENDVVELAELISTPVVQAFYLNHWANNFPTNHSLYAGEYRPGLRLLKNTDLILNLGGSLPYPYGRIPQSIDMIEVRNDLDNMGRVYPSLYHIPANVKLFVIDLINTIRSQASKAQLRRLHERRWNLSAELQYKKRESLELITKRRWNDSPLSVERLGSELSRALDPDAIIVDELDGGRGALNYFNFGKGQASRFTTTGTALGWSLGAAAGVKLAHPDRQVIAMMGDGAFLFGGSQALWTMKRYEIPVIVVVFNNHSYDNERNRIWGKDSRQAEAQKDMTCYLGNPDVDFARMASAYNVKVAKVTEPEQLEAALARAIETARDGQPFLLDVLVARRGHGADLTWHPEYSLMKSQVSMQ